MKKTPFPLVFGCLCALLLPVAALPAQDAPAPASLRQRTNFDADWRFQKGDPAGSPSAQVSYARIKGAVIASSAAFLGTGSGPVSQDLGKDVPCTQPGFDDGGWRALDLPHDWAIEGPFDQALPGDTGKLPWQGIGWYRKHFKLPAEGLKDRCTFLDVDGAMAYAAVWCNGKFVGGWPYGYTSFRLDLTPFLKTDGSENVLAVRLDNPPESSRWYPGAGIYRHVWLVQTAPVHVAHWGTAVRTPKVSAQEATVIISVTTDYGTSASGKKLVNQTEIFECNAQGQAVGKPVATVAANGATGIPEHTTPGRITLYGETATIPHPRLWDLQHPFLYAAVTTVLENGQPVDRYVTTFGVRSIQFTADNGFLLNGKRVPLQGVCDHHDLGALGTAINDTALERQVTKLKEMGCNAIRTSHNPPAPELLDLCDRLGILVMDESFDCWKQGKNRNDYNLLWTDWHEKDMRALVRRDRNHPSVILWSIGNEIPDQETAEGPALAAELTALAHDEDGGPGLSRPTTSACNDPRSGYNDFHKGIDVMGFNYKPEEYRKFRASSPDQPVISTESSSCVSSRDFYLFPVTNDKNGGKADFQVSSYDLYAPPWATPPDWEFKGQDEAPFTGGEFVWTGFDYIGEPTPYGEDVTNLLNFTDPVEKQKMAEQLRELGRLRVPSRSSYFGIIDLAGFPKDRFYLYQARWNPTFPMAHILPHWTWPDRVGQVTPIHVYTSGDEAELFLNGQSLGRKKKGPMEYRLRWDDVKYAPGEVKVVAYKNGKEWATDSVKTAGDAARVALLAENFTVHGGGAGTAYFDAVLVDKDGTPVPQAGNAVKFTVSGPAEIVATDNGDATSHAPFQAHAVKAFNGKCLVIVRAKAGASGPITVHAEVDGLQKGEATVQADL